MLVENHYAYDGNGNRIVKQQQDTLTRYAYTEIGQLKKVVTTQSDLLNSKEKLVYEETLFYDQAGNRVKSVINGAEASYSYDNRNRLIQLTKDNTTTDFKWDHAGNLLQDDKAHYHYDAWNRTTKVETFDGNIQVNRYDAEGLRYEMEENGQLVQFLFNTEREVIAEKEETWRLYIRSSELLASSNDYDQTYYHYASDEMGSITHLVDNRKLLNEYEYDAWGKVVSQREAVPNRFQFNGQQLDPITGQYYLRARFYNPVIGRFTQEDTYRGDGLNLYAYCANNPVYYVDPTGNAKSNSGCPPTIVNAQEARDANTSQMQVEGGSGTLGHGSKSKPNALKEFDIAPYGDFKNYPNDNLTGHELLQNAWLKAHGKILNRGQGLSKDNPAIALYEDPIHKYISSQQRKLKLNTKNLVRTSWRQNVLINIKIMKSAGVPRDKIFELAKQTRQFALDNGF